jgi:hypothetical protein
LVTVAQAAGATARARARARRKNVARAKNIGDAGRDDAGPVLGQEVGDVGPTREKMQEREREQDGVPPR